MFDGFVSCVRWVLGIIKDGFVGGDVGDGMLKKKIGVEVNGGV